MNISNQRIAAIISSSATPASDICALPIDSYRVADWEEIKAHFRYAGGGIMQVAHREMASLQELDC